MAAWGFQYRGVHSLWVKTAADGHIIHGQGVRPTFTKPTTEFLLVGSTCMRGRPLPLLTEAQSQVVLAPRGRHSEKPSLFRERIVELLGDVRASSYSPVSVLRGGTPGGTKSGKSTRRHDTD